jgi:Tol biopolymer transport system component/tRNA A-37 threonylcarbamoyl transferase component Bud32
MGEVYRARDTRLDRTVAIKVLNSSLSQSPELKARFDREARAISALQHPHICVLHDVGSQDGTDFLVMEFLEGESLATRVKSGPLPLEQIYKIAIEVADALEKAHRAGIVHRDLKPGNVMLTKAGAKLLDFGLAKATGPLAAAAASGASASVFAAAMTMTSPASPLTSAGSIVGTIQYMSPEQIAGQEADARSDIFAFGAMLYEMTTGKRAFEGKTQASIVGSILAVEPSSVRSLQPRVPAALDRMIRICLAKDPDERFQSAHDIKLQLQLLAEGDEQRPETATVVATQPSRVPWIAAAVTALVAIGLGAAFVQQALQPKPVVRSTVLPPDKVGIMAQRPMLSPDGTKIVFVGRDDKGVEMLYLRPVSALSAQPLAGTEGALFPFWSPDSRSVGFFSDQKVKKIDTTGGPPQALCDAGANPRGGSWSKAGVILFAPSNTEPLHQVSATGGVPTVATKLDPAHGDTSHRWPQFLPDGKTYLFMTRGGGAEKTGVSIGTVGSPDHKFLLASDSSAYYVAPGYLMFVRDGTLMAQPFSASKLALTGEAVPVAEHVAINSTVYLPLFSASDNGELLYQGGGANSGRKLLWFDREGKPAGSVGEPGPFVSPAISPDGKRVAVTIADSANTDIWIYDLARATKTRLTFDPSTESAAAWSRDGNRVFYQSSRKGPANHLYSKAADGSGDTETLLETPNVSEFLPNLTTDGRFAVYMRSDATTRTGNDIWAVPLSGDRKPFPIVQTNFNDVTPAVSPDGKWLAYANNETGHYEVYVTPFPGGGSKWQVSTSGGGEPHWRRDGKELYYLSADNHMMAISLTAQGNGVALGVPQLLFQTSAVIGPLGPFDVTADGKKFLVNSETVQNAGVPLVLVQNWVSAMKK